MDKSEITQKVKILLDNNGIKVSDSALDLFIDSSIEYILDYCNLYELPEELNNTLIKKIVNECYKSTGNLNNVASIQEGGRSVSFINYKTNEITKQTDEEIKIVLNRFKVPYR